MSIIAYASADPLPIINPDVDGSVDLSLVVLPQDVDLYGGVVDSINPGGPFSYFWTILSEAEPSTPAAFTGGTGPTDQDVTIQANAWGNVRLFLVVTNTATLETSEPDPLLAPDSAFVQIRVLSAVEGLEKPAPGERNYYSHIYPWADAIEAGGGVGAHDIAFHSDVVTATGAKLELLVDGSYAEDPPATDMHKHRGAAIDDATTLTTGVVTLEDIGSGACIQRERVQFCASPAGSLLSTGFWPGVIVPVGYDGDAGGNFSLYCAAWRVKDAVVVEEMSIALADNGSDTGGISNNYDFTLYSGSLAQYLANTLTNHAPGTVSVLSPSTAHEPGAGRATGLSLSVAAGDYIAVKCIAAPLQSDGVEPGGGLTITVHAYRQV